MRDKKHFDAFLKDTVNINQTRLTRLDNSVDALKRFLRASDWKPRIRRFEGQGSWKHGTIIKPVNGRAFDADLLSMVEAVDGWEARDYVNSLKRVFLNDATYKDKVSRYSHCVTITYAGERKIDIAPCLVNRGGRAELEVCNGISNDFERSEPTDYTSWLVERNRWTGKNGLKKTSRLVKYLRDIKRTFSCESVLLTTIIGERITLWDQFDKTNFEDVPTALRTIVGRLDDWLQENSSKPKVTNPKLDSEVLSNLWSDTQYTNFRDTIHRYRGWIDDAYLESDPDESIKKWRKIFGDDFAKGVVLKRTAVVEAADASLHTELSAWGIAGDLVQRVVRYGLSQLPAGPDWLAHRKKPTWTPASSMGKVSVYATRHTSRNGTWIDSPASGSGPFSKNQSLCFGVRQSDGTSLPGGFEVHWRVANTGGEAVNARSLRGDFYRSNDGYRRWETLRYRGVHCVEAFVVRKTDRLLVADSTPFYVMIE